MKADNEYDLIIIGAGINGLSAGIAYALNTQGSKVLIIEKNAVSGGYVTTFARSGFLFDTCQMSSNISDILEYLGIDIDFHEFAQDFIRVFKVDPQTDTVKTFELFSGEGAFEEQFIKLFPDEAEKLKNMIGNKLQNMVRLNQSRMNYYLRFQEMIEEYNSGSLNIDEFFKRLIDFTKGLNEEEKRNIAEHLSEEELAIFDILTKPDMKLSNKDIQQVKKVARDLLETLKREKLVIDWRKKQQARAGVQVTIKNILEGTPLNIWGNGEVVRDFVYIDDVVSAFISSVRYEGGERVFNFGSGVGTSINRLIDILESCTGKKCVKRYHPPRSCDVPSICLDISKAGKHLGWFPAVSIEDGVRMTYEAMRLAFETGRLPVDSLSGCKTVK